MQIKEFFPNLKLINEERKRQEQQILLSLIKQQEKPTLLQLIEFVEL
jgi:hypothetical protein